MSSCSRYTIFFLFESRFHRQNLPFPNALRYLRTDLSLNADVSENTLPFVSQSINNFSDYDISQTHDWECPSLSPHVLLINVIPSPQGFAHGEIRYQRDPNPLSKNALFNSSFIHLLWYHTPLRRVKLPFVKINTSLHKALLIYLTPPLKATKLNKRPYPVAQRGDKFIPVIVLTQG